MRQQVETVRSERVTRTHAKSAIRGVRLVAVMTRQNPIVAIHSPNPVDRYRHKTVFSIACTPAQITLWVSARQLREPLNNSVTRLAGVPRTH